MKMIRSRLQYILLLLSLLIIMSLITVLYNFYGLNNYIDSEIEEAKYKNGVTHNHMNSIAQLIYDTELNTPAVVSLFKDAYGANKKQRSIIREKLFTLLKDKYKVFSKHNIFQMQFHLPDNVSFLRFHQPSKFGDDLTLARKTVAYVNQYKKPVNGFESGKVVSGFRYAYPLFDGDKHIGSVELSFSTHLNKNDYERQHEHHFDFIILKSVIQKKAFKQALGTYEPYILNDAFLIEKPFTASQSMLGLYKLLKSDEELKTNMNKMKLFSTYVRHDNHYNLVVFTPIENAITKEKVAYSIGFSKSVYLSNFFTIFYIQMFFSFLMSIAITFFYYRERENKKSIQRVLKQNRAIINSSDNMVLVFEDEHIIDCNKAFLDFFNINHLDEYPNKESFSREFIEYDDYFYCQTHTGWIAKMLDLGIEERMISILDDNLYGRALKVAIQSMSEENNQYVLILSDITKERIKEKTLEKKALFDRLTGIYNRHYFEDVIEQKFNLAQDEQSYLSLIMFDIDHFKAINDSYGHDVGDRALKWLSNTIQHSMRGQDIFARWGGEEFMLLVEIDLDAAVKLAEKLRILIEIEVKLTEIPNFTCSFGVVCLTEFNTISDGYKKVDKLLYHAKESGRNKVVSDSILSHKS